MGKILVSCVLLSVAVVAAMGAAINDEGKFAQEKRQAFLQRMLYNDNEASMEQPPLGRESQIRGESMRQPPMEMDSFSRFAGTQNMATNTPPGQALGIDAFNNVDSQYYYNGEPGKIDIEQEEMGYPNDGFAEEEARRGGVTYVRWGRTKCSAKGAQLVYEGRAAGSHTAHRGGGSNYQCVTMKPENFDFGPGTVNAGLIYGSEYDVWGNVPKAALHLHDHDVPCAVCYVPTRTAKIMIPGTYKCPNAWTTEYYGYLMTEYYGHYRSTFECVDKDPEEAISGHSNHNGALFYFVEPRCGSLPCPPYDQQKEMTCAVCTR